jgi:hypothetical protein
LTASGFNHLGNGVYRRVASAADATAGLRQLAFDPTDNLVAVGNSVTTGFTLSADDGFFAPTVDGNTTVAATSVNDAPTIAGAVPQQQVNDNATLLALQNVTIGDVDNPAQTLTVTVSLSAGANGVFTPASVAASGFSNLGNGTYQRTGSAAQVTAAIQQLSFDPTDNQAAPGSIVNTTLAIAAHDGLTLVSDSQTTVQARSMNDTTSIAGAAPYALNDNAVGLPFAAVTIADLDAAQNLSLTVLLSSSANGGFTMPSLTLAGFTPLGPGTYQRSGTAAQLTTAIRQLVFDPTENQVAPASTVVTTLTIVIDEGLGTPLIGNGNTTVTATSVNDAPAVIGLGAGQPVNDNATIAPFPSATIGDVDPAQILTVTVGLSSPGTGSFTAASLAASGFSDQGGGVYRRTGSAAQLTTAVRQLVFDPVENQLTPGTATSIAVTISVSDGMAGPVGGATMVEVHSINDPPTGVGRRYTCIRPRLKVSAAAGVLAGARDVDSGTVLKAVLVARPRRRIGRLTLNPDGSFVFRPRPTFPRGRATFVFQIHDNHGGVSAPIAVTIRVRRRV